jgi:hypothetical protein
VDNWTPFSTRSAARSSGLKTSARLTKFGRSNVAVMPYLEPAVPIGLAGAASVSVAIFLLGLGAGQLLATSSAMELFIVLQGGILTLTAVLSVPTAKGLGEGRLLGNNELAASTMATTIYCWARARTPSGQYEN